MTYGEEWKKEMHKFNVRQLEASFGLTKGDLNKSDFIEKIRENLRISQIADTDLEKEAKAVIEEVKNTRDAAILSQLLKRFKEESLPK